VRSALLTLLAAGCAPAPGATEAGVTSAAPADAAELPDAASVAPADAAELPDAASVAPADAAELPDAASVGAPRTTIVRTRGELLAALAAARRGDTVFVAGAAVIDLTGDRGIGIPAGVTLASDRGQGGSPGALLFSADLRRKGAAPASWSLFRAQGDGVRVTGLRLRGPDTEIRDDAYTFETSRGVEGNGVADLVVDRCELWGWPHAAVLVRNALEAHVVGNDIHHNRRAGLGYGVVVVDDSSALVERNTFRQNRHAIAASGIRTIRYEARHNLVVDDAGSHGFDVHGEGEALDDDSPWAGDVVHVRHNSFRSAAQPAFKVRGRPVTGAFVADNCFAAETPARAVLQSRFTGNLFVGANSYGATTGACHERLEAAVGWALSRGGRAGWERLARYTFAPDEVALGDFDGDGRTDLFRATGARFYYAPGGADPWRPLAASGLTRQALRFGDFDGDGRTDVLTIAGGRMQTSSGGAGPWRPLAATDLSLEALRFGDFDGDGKTDAFAAVDGRWRYAPGAEGAWVPLASSSATVADLAFADLDGDGRTDVVSIAGGRLRFSRGGASSWVALVASELPLSALRFGDFDADGRDDVFFAAPGRWLVSSGGSGAAQPLAHSTCAAKWLAVGDFDGDGTADVLGTRCGE
jgi:hypothetical protein